MLMPCIMLPLTVDNIRSTSSGLIYTDNGYMIDVIPLIICGVILILGSVFMAISEVYEQHLTGKKAAKEVLICSLFVLGGIFILRIGILDCYQAVAMIDKDKNNLQLEEHFFLGKARTSVYSFNEIANIELHQECHIYTSTGSRECRFSSVFIILNNRKRVWSAVRTEDFAQKLSEYSGKELLKTYEWREIRDDIPDVP